MASQETSALDFGLLITFAMPGYAAIWELSYLRPGLLAMFGAWPVVTSGAGS
jgi:hypothetical protein